MPCCELLQPVAVVSWSRRLIWSLLPRSGRPTTMIWRAIKSPVNAIVMQ
jgi:hypothetical protein